MLLVNERSDAHVDSVALSVYQLRRDREDLATAAIFLVLKPRRVSCGAELRRIGHTLQAHTTPMKLAKWLKSTRQQSLEARLS